MHTKYLPGLLLEIFQEITSRISPGFLQRFRHRFLLWFFPRFLLAFFSENPSVISPGILSRMYSLQLTGFSSGISAGIPFRDISRYFIRYYFTFFFPKVNQELFMSFFQKLLLVFFPGFLIYSSWNFLIILSKVLREIPFEIVFPQFF